jgi:hypothetical protein
MYLFGLAALLTIMNLPAVGQCNFAKRVSGYPTPASVRRNFEPGSGIDATRSAVGDPVLGCAHANVTFHPRFGSLPMRSYMQWPQLPPREILRTKNTV